MERLLTRSEVAGRLGIRPRTFSRHKARLVAEGLQPVKVGLHDKFRESSLDRLIRDAAENGTAL